MDQNTLNQAKISGEQLLALLGASQQFWEIAFPTQPEKEEQQEHAEAAPSEAGETKCPKKEALITPVITPVILLDMRSFVCYNQGHIDSAINVCIPQTLAKRASFCSRSIEAGISGPLARDLFARRRGALIVLYDQKDGDVTPLLAKCFQALMKEQLCTKVLILEGGFISFQQEHPELIRGNKKGKPCLGSPFPAPLTAPANLSFNPFPGFRSPSKEAHSPQPTLSHLSSASSPSASASSMPTFKIPAATAAAAASSKEESIIPITDYLFLSGSLIAQDYHCLSQNGIRYIVNSAEELENCFPECGEFLYTKLDLQDHPSQNICFVKVFENAFAVIDEAKKNGSRALVHCRGGRSRSATIVIAYLMKTFHLTFQQAYEYVQAKNPKISPNLGFVGQLIRYEAYLNGGEGKMLMPPQPAISPRICREESPNLFRGRGCSPFRFRLSSASSPEIRLENSHSLEVLWPQSPSPLSSQS